jgi:hypothetical protein
MLSVGVMSVTSERGLQADYGQSKRYFWGKVVPLQAMTADGEGGGLDPLILYLGTR